MKKFTLVLGEKNNYLAGKMWTAYNVEVLEDKMVCTCKKDHTIVSVINYSEFKEATFGIGSGNLWLQCELDNGPLVFCSPRACWKSENGKKLIECINNACTIEGMKAYKQYTGPFFFLHVFK